MACEVQVDPATLSPGDGECYDLTGDAGLDGTGLVSDATVQLSAPSIQAPSFERDQIQISGEFDESEAKELALALQLAPS